MINKTSSIEFKKYGSTYEEHLSSKDNNLICRKLNTSSQVISHMYCFSCEVYILFLNNDESQMFLIFQDLSYHQLK